MRVSVTRDTDRGEVTHEVTVTKCVRCGVTADLLDPDVIVSRVNGDSRYGYEPTCGDCIRRG